ncbi:unnamed protein product [Closterium sp. NIES-64]|nr:unnamed protein product [Closterium sp. NIES-64]
MNTPPPQGKDEGHDTDPLLGLRQRQQNPGEQAAAGQSAAGTPHDWLPRQWREENEERLAERSDRLSPPATHGERLRARLEASPRRAQGPTQTGDHRLRVRGPRDCHADHDYSTMSGLEIGAGTCCAGGGQGIAHDAMENGAADASPAIRAENGELESDALRIGVRVNDREANGETGNGDLANDAQGNGCGSPDDEGSDARGDLHAAPRSVRHKAQASDDAENAPGAAPPRSQNAQRTPRGLPLSEANQRHAAREDGAGPQIDAGFGPQQQEDEQERSPPGVAEAQVHSPRADGEARGGEDRDEERACDRGAQFKRRGGAGANHRAQSG